jgi:glutaredoxin
LLTSLGYEYEEKRVDMWSPELMDVVQTTWMTTVPQIFSWEISRENLIWGYTELTQLQADWKLEEKLK